MEIIECEKNCDKFPKRQKVIVIPEKVEYFSVHRITVGKKEYKIEMKEMYMGHRKIRKGKYIKCKNLIK
jgi:hypothetical protein